MILRSLELRHFGKFSEKNIDFRRGMNLVIGPNEAGKSTLVEAIPAALFGVRNKERFRPWGRQGSSEVALVLEGRDHTVRIERDVGNDQVALVERDDLYQNLYQFEGKASPQGRSAERSEYLEQLTRLFGVADEDIFRASLFFGQGSLEVSGDGGMATKIKTLLSGFVEVDYDRVLQSLQEDYFNITRKNPWGRDKNRDRELEEVQQLLQDLEDRWTAQQGGVQDLENLRIEISKLTRAIEEGRRDFEKGDRYLSWVRQQYELEEKATRLRKEFNRLNQENDKISQLEERRGQIENELKAAGLPRQIPEQLPRLLEESEEVRQELVRIQSETVSLRERLVEMPQPPWKWRTGASILAVAAALGGGWYLPDWTLWAAAAGTAALIGIWTPFLIRMFRFRGEMSNLKGQGKVLEESRAEAQARLAAIDEQFGALGMKSSSVERIKMQRNMARHRELLEGLHEVESGLKVLEKADSLSEEKQRVTQELAIIEETLGKERHKYGESLIPKDEFPAADEKLRHLGEELREMESRLLELTRQEARLQGTLSDLEQIDEEGETLRERERLLTRRSRALLVGFDLLNEAVEEFRQTYLESFATDIGHYLSRISAARYSEVRLEEDFRLLLKTRGGQWQPVEHFSKGTVDAVYFAVRLALTRHLSRGRNLPLLLDDPLVNLDSSRFAETIDILENISSDHQVVLLAHDERLLKRAARERWNVILLEKIKSTPAIEPSEKKEEVQQLFLL